MKRFTRSMMTGAIALMIASSAFGCSAGGDKLADKPVPIQQDGSNRPIPGAKQVEEAPAALHVWVDERADETRPNSAMIEHEGKLILAVIAGQKNSGGYSVVLDRVETAEGGARIFVKLQSPAPGSMNITAMTQPVGYFELSNINGKVAVQFSSGPDQTPLSLEPTTLQNTPQSAGGGTGEYSDGSFTAKVQWVDDNTLNIQGKANVPDLQFVVKADSKPLAQADTTVKEGQYVANMIIQGGAKLDLELSVINPDGGQVLAMIPLKGTTK